MEKYDVVIIGSGLGGLLSGYILAKEGMSVCIIEKNHCIGGALQSFKRDDCFFDTGAHYIGGLSEGQNLYKYFKYFNLIDTIKYKKLDENSFDILSFSGDSKKYNFAMGYDNFAEEMSNNFPDEKDNIINYTNKIKEINNNFPLFNLRIENKSGLELKYFGLSAYQFIDSITNNIKLQSILAGTNILYAGIKEKTPLYIHSLINGSYIESSWRVVGGNYQIADVLAESIKKFNGVVYTNKKAMKFKFFDNVLKYIELDNGEIIEGKYFISDIHPKNTLDMLDTGTIRNAYRTRINSIENTISCFSLYIVLKKNKFKYINSNHYNFKNENVWICHKKHNNDFPEHYLFMTPVPENNSDYADCVNVITPIHYSDFSKWENTKVGNRGVDYEEYKNELKDKLLKRIYEDYPEIKNSIEYVYASTPLTYRDYIGNNDGSLYGIIRDYNDYMMTMIQSRTKIPNLLLTGQNIILHGVLGVTIGSIVTCSHLIGLEYLVNKINNY